MSQRRAQAKKEFGCRTYKDYKQLIKDKDIDLFINALPSCLHPKGTIEALNAGHNVVCEKPLAVKVRDFDRMAAAARKARRLFAPFQNSRFYPFFQKMQEVIASGKLGRIIHIRSNWSHFGRRWDWQTRQDMWGGALNNTGPHPLDHAVMLFGPGRAKVFCKMESGEGSYGDADDFCLVTLYGRGSPTIEVVLSAYQAYPCGEMYYVGGSLGGMTGGPAGLKWKYYDPAKAPGHSLMRSWPGDRRYCAETLPSVEKSWTPPKTRMDSFQANSKAFYDNIHDVLTRKGKLIVTPQQVRRQIAVIEECHRQNPLPVRS